MNDFKHHFNKIAELGEKQLLPFVKDIAEQPVILNAHCKLLG